MKLPALAGYRRLLVAAVVLATAVALALAGVIKSGDVTTVLVTIVGAFCASDGIEKLSGAFRKGEAIEAAPAFEYTAADLDVNGPPPHVDLGDPRYPDEDPDGQERVVVNVNCTGPGCPA